ncbi:hypothetical protein GE061_018760 [Apolygus lucorum]|uniref:Ketosynthase family 3 (KS3) domain-containing protein n=1 Tax=Apolygus lucorum TaxID=248454 RepID=A0A8S9X677_APOLU|nr:hypothetical protein GE061_018760 [Apolygus lucorum]
MALRTSLRAKPKIACLSRISLFDSDIANRTNIQKSQWDQMSFEKCHDVVISGMAGIYPESDDVDELWRRLLDKEDMVTIDGRRWVPGEFDVPPGTGKVKNPEKFDMTFFGIHRKLCEKMDPYTRLLCEQAYRAVCDAGVNPRCLDGSNTAVIMASFSSEPEHDMGASVINQGTYNVLAFSRTMQANRLSYFLNLRGPSYQLDCSGCGGIQAIQYACDLISTGICESAIVGSCHLLNKPEPSFHYQVMGRLSEDSMTRSFSADADGYARSETCVTFFLQRKKDANRIYGTILAADVLCHGNKSEAFTEFPLSRYDEFLIDTYKNANVDPNDLAYVEAYGAASKKLDAMELNALSRTLLKKRTEPLWIGSIKTNIGHTEGSSAMASLTKVLLAMDRGIIPPNLNYSSPNPDVPDLVSGKLKVVVEPTPLPGDIVGVCELSMTGICGHIILKSCEKVKPPKDTQDDDKQETQKRLPFLVMMSGRDEDVLAANMKKIESCGVDEEFVILINSLYKNGIKPHVHRGYTVINGTANSYNKVEPAPSGEERPIWFMYSGMGSQWPMMAKALMDLPIFAQAIHKCHATLAPKGVNLLEIVTKNDASMFDVILNSFVGIAAVQIGLTDILRAVGIKPDGIIGHSVGELGCAYADGCMTAEQMILSAHARGRASIEAELIKGMMAAVGAGYNAMKDKLPPSIEVACHNSKESCTLSGPAEDMAKYIAQLKETGMFAKLVNVANIAYHSRYIKPAAPALLKYLKEILPVPVKRSSKWVSSSNLEANWNTALAQHSSAEYHTNNLLSSVLFEEACAHIPSNAIVIEIAPHGLLQAIVKRSLPRATHIPLTSRFDPNNLMYLLSALGKMYLAGIPVDLRPLYPSATFPVSRGTPAISPLIDWLRDENFIIRRSLSDNDSPSPLCKFVSIKKGVDKFEQLISNKINKRIILPIHFYYNNIIEMFTKIGANDSMPLVLEDFKFSAQAEVTYNPTTEIRFQLLQGTGNVVVNNQCDEGAIVVQGKINITDVASVKDLHALELALPQSGKINRHEMLGFMKSMGAERDESQVLIDDIYLMDSEAIATGKWTGDIGCFLASILQLVEFYETKKSNVLKMIYKVGEMKINLPLLSDSAKKDMLIRYDALNKTLQCEGIHVSFIDCKNPCLGRAEDKEFFFSFELPKFVPYSNDDSLSLKDFVTISIQLILENTLVSHDTIIKIMGVGHSGELQSALDNISDSLKYAGSTQITTFESEQAFSKQGSSILLQKDVFLIFSEAPSEEVLRSLSLINNGFVMMPVGKNDQLVKNRSKVIFESNVDDVMYCLHSVNNKNYKRQYEVVNLNDTNYLSFLENQLTKAGEIKVVDDSQPVKTIILWGEVDSMVTVDSIVEETKNLPYYHLLHYWFFYGNSPDFNSGDVDFKNQIQRDVKMNISWGGIWGSLRLLPANVNDGSMETARPTKFYYPLSAVASSYNLRALGLNLQDSLKEGACAELGVYDYVTSTCMGLGMYNPDSKTFNPDSILSWPIPSRWTHEEAATVPLLYSLASYIIHHSNNVDCTNDQTILVTRAMLPLSQALIALALYENMTVYATVYGEDQKRALMKLFPKLPRQNIYDCSTVAFFVQVIRDTGGVYKVINSFDNTQMIEPCLKCVKPLGVLVYISQSLMNQAQMGMRRFNEEIIATGASIDIVLKSSDEVKIEIVKNVQDAISKGAVIPPRNVTTVSPSTLHTDAAQTVRLGSDKFIVSTKVSKAIKEEKVYIEDETKGHVIVEGKIPTETSINILEWLLKRGSRKVVVFMRQSHPFGSTSLRLQSLRDQYKWADIDVRSANHLSSKANIKKFVEEYTAPGLEMIFFLGSGLREKIEQFDELLSAKTPNCNMICVGKGGENVCERRKKNSLPSLFIRCSTSTLESVDLSLYMDNLIKDSSRVPVVLVNKCTIHSRALHGFMANLLHIPDSNVELQELTKQCTPRATFIEIQTASPTKQFNRELYPMFLIPGLRPNRLHKMASQLYCPAFEARLPSGATDLDQLADELANQLASLPQNMFTIVADDWGGILALRIAARLEILSKMATVILLNATPASTLKWANGLLKDDIALIGKYLTVSSEVKSSVKSSSWDETLRLAIEKSGIKKYEDRILIRDGLNLLRNRLKAVQSAKPPLNKLKTTCHVVELVDEAFEEHGLQDYLRKEPILHLKDNKNVTEMIDTSVADDANTLLMFEYKDAANPPIAEYIGMNVVKKPTWMSSLLYRVRE